MTYNILSTWLVILPSCHLTHRELPFYIIFYNFLFTSARTPPQGQGISPTMNQLPTFKIHAPKVVTNQKCQCQCSHAAPGKLAVCHSGKVGKLDPEMALCDVCFFELREVNAVRQRPTCQYPPEVLDRIWSLVDWLVDNSDINSPSLSHFFLVFLFFLSIHQFFISQPSYHLLMNDKNHKSHTKLTINPPHTSFKLSLCQLPSIYT